MGAARPSCRGVLAFLVVQKVHIHQPFYLTLDLPGGCRVRILFLCLDGRVDSVGMNSGAAGSRAQPQPAEQGHAAPPGSAPALAPASKAHVSAPAAPLARPSQGDGSSAGSGSGGGGALGSSSSSSSDSTASSSHTTASSSSTGGLYSIIGIAATAQATAIMTRGSSIRSLQGQVLPLLLLLGVVAALAGTAVWAMWRRRRLQIKAVPADAGISESQSIQLLGRTLQSLMPPA